ncbi:MAG: hypothetical protein Kow0069_19260 [Promethearchaeota archaeon]
MNRRILTGALLGAAWALVSPFFFTGFNFSSASFAGATYQNVTPGVLLELLGTRFAEGLGLWTSLPFQGSLVGTWSDVLSRDAHFFNAFFLNENNLATAMVWAGEGFLVAASFRQGKYAVWFGVALVLILQSLAFLVGLAVGAAQLQWDGLLLAFTSLVVGEAVGNVAAKL